MYQLAGCRELSWTELKQEYKESRKKVVKYIDKEKEENSKYKKVNLEISRSMNRELEDRIKDIEAKCLYEFNSVSEDLIAKSILTDRQRQVVQLRQKYTITEISGKLGIKPSSVFDIYKESLKKIEKYLKAKDKELSVLSPQQRKIYLMMKEGKRNKEIAEKLGIRKEGLPLQKKRILNKLKLVEK